ncbi:disease resistance protein RPM1-like [Canna indica]|uniref:Disease resistance protein RPM1-like n=1 Tax=Canna indica TaxID=4628 RepID=A0AAQ3KNR7_9LILI|nr:disease resistance protein RPM1-like [Canna indica]
MERAFPDNKRGSRIVITTRSDEVAKLANEENVLVLRELKEDEAWDLFCQKAFWQEQDKSCPGILKKIGQDIVKKCEGLPLAIVAIARLLSLKRKTKYDWERFQKKLSWEFINNQSLRHAEHVLSLSYDDLPSYLRNCFLYCSMFPDEKMTRTKLIRLWVAESFIQDRGTQTMEEVAEEYLKELVQRSMLYVVERNSFERVRKLRMHNLLRDLTLEAARKENFSNVLNESELTHEARRLSVHDYSTNSILLRMDFSRTRSFFVFKHDSSLQRLLHSVASKAKYLRVIDLEAAEIGKIPDAFTKLFNLHYLGLRNTDVKRLPNSIGRLRNLQTLDLRGTGIETLPEGITRLVKLRHLLSLNFSSYDHRLPINSVTCAQPRKGLWNLTSLQQLDMAVNEVSMARLENLTQLRVLKVAKVRGAHCQELSTSISQMPFLRNLWIIACDEKEVLQLQKLNPILKNLQKLHLHGRLLDPVVKEQRYPTQRLVLRLKLRLQIAARALQRVAARRWRRRGVRDSVSIVRYSELRSRVFLSLGDNLRELCLSWSGLQEDPLPTLRHLQKLTLLRLRWAFDGVLLCFRKDWFPELQELQLSNLPNLFKIILEHGSLTSLRFLTMYGLSKLMLLPEGIESISIRRLYISECNPIFLHAVKEDRDDNLKHIPRILHRYQVDDKWHSENLSRHNMGKQPDLSSQPNKEEGSTSVSNEEFSHQASHKQLPIKDGVGVSLRSMHENDVNRTVGVGVVDSVDPNTEVGALEDTS